ncbi:MAG TPA: chromosomal replication initiator protein DnaA [Gemmatimonadaceae bacterium]|nr:chromosomal replication initiator protein DnaA [Gemmatimonadaceae bacterium]
MHKLVLVLNPSYTFAHFIIGKSNDLAAASATAVAARPGRAYNPLFIYGETGLGKTHLMQAVAHEILGRKPETKLVYVSAEQFTNDLVASMQQADLSPFHARYHTAELLLIDDVHILAGRRAAQDAFSETFAVLYGQGRQIMMTSDRAPQSSGLDSELVGRFKSGKIADVSRPDVEHRHAILREKVKLGAKNKVPDDVVAFIADQVPTNVRAMEGALTRLLAYSVLKSRPVTLDLAREALPQRPAPPSQSNADATLITQRVAAEWGVTPEALASKRRTREVVEPRQVAMHLCREILGMTLTDIGAAFGGRDHSTVIHGLERVQAEMGFNPAFSARVKRLAEALR